MSSWLSSISSNFSQRARSWEIWSSPLPATERNSLFLESAFSNSKAVCNEGRKLCKCWQRHHSSKKMEIQTAFALRSVASEESMLHNAALPRHFRWFNLHGTAMNFTAHQSSLFNARAHLSCRSCSGWVMLVAHKMQLTRSCFLPHWHSQTTLHVFIVHCWRVGSTLQQQMSTSTSFSCSHCFISFRRNDHELLAAMPAFSEDKV